MYKLLWTGAACAALLAVITLPGTSAPHQAPATTVAEAQLIDRLHDMANPPELSAVPIIEANVTLSPPRPSLPPGPESAAADNEKLVVAADALNLRANPSRSADVIDLLPMGESVEVAERVTGNEGVWVRIATRGGVTGWAYSEYLAEPDQQLALQRSQS